MLVNTAEIKRVGKSLLPKLRKAVKQISRRGRKDLDAHFQEAHEIAFTQIDCLDCANCCKTTGPRLSRSDTERISAHLKVPIRSFSEQYLHTDEDGDLVMKSLPCPFLLEDNACSIYEVRPKACRTYPHTDRRRQKQLLDLHLRNVEICPAVQKILTMMEEHYPYS